MKLNIGIAGTRGIPNHYGGFEQFATFLSRELVGRGHTVTVYNTHHHPFGEPEWNGVRIVRCYDPASIGTAGQFLYDLNCVLDARKRNFDVLLILGYTSSSVWGRWYPKHTAVITNMDGMEWKRSKYSPWVQRFLMHAERRAVRFSDQLVADSLAIQNYLERKYDRGVAYISYGADIPEKVAEKALLSLGVQPGQYHLLIARMEPENNIEMILDGLCQRNDGKTVLVVANHTTAFGRRLQRKYRAVRSIVFAGTIYDRSTLEALRANSYLYFHGHSVGGTNPSLLEAMAAGALIAAHDNPFNRAVLGDQAYWFRRAADIAALVVDDNDRSIFGRMQVEKIRSQYNWKNIVDAYEALFLNSIKRKL